jgi:hypothetical protein
MQFKHENCQFNHIEPVIELFFYIQVTFASY